MKDLLFIPFTIQMGLFLHPASDIPNPFLVLSVKQQIRNGQLHQIFKGKHTKEYADYVHKPTEFWTSLVQSYCKAEEYRLTKMCACDVAEFRFCFQSCNITLNFKAKKSYPLFTHSKAGTTPRSCIVSPFEVSLSNMAVLPSGPQTWKGTETRSGYSGQPQKSNVCMYRNTKTPSYKLRCKQGGNRQHQGSTPLL